MTIDKSNNYSIPRLLSGSEIDSFAYVTIKDRMPVILTKALDAAVRLSFEYPNDPVYSKIKSEEEEILQQEMKGIVKHLIALKYQMQHDRHLHILTDKLADAHIWNDQISKLDKHANSWFSANWLFSECYMYRRIQEVFANSTVVQNFDVFAHNKQSSLLNCSNSIRKWCNIIETDYRLFSWVSSGVDIRQLLSKYINLSLWGNQMDLSLNVTEIQIEDIENNQNMRQNDMRYEEKIIVNHLIELSNTLINKRKETIHLVLDNAGLELFSDLALADMLIAVGIVEKIVLHIKNFSWFVSDTTQSDLQFLLNVTESHPEKFSNFKNIAQRWKTYLSKGTWQVRQHWFWTTPNPFWDMNRLAPDLYKDLFDDAGKKCVIFKGDLNYRKLTYDAMWPVNTEFTSAVGPLVSSKTPFVALRTCKSDVVVGISEEKCEQLDKLDSQWRFNGKWGKSNLSVPLNLIRISFKHETEMGFEIFSYLKKPTFPNLH